MQKTIMPALLLLALAMPASAQVYRCEEGGRTSYQSRPCAGGEVAGEVELRTLGRMGSGNHGGQVTFRRPPDDASVRQKFRAVSSAVEVVSLKAQDCDWAIRVHRDPAGCQDFAEVQQQYVELINYADEHSEEFAMHLDTSQLNALLRTMNEITDVQAFVIEYSNQR